jgi:hypothetical protein
MDGIGSVSGTANPAANSRWRTAANSISRLPIVEGGFAAVVVAGVELFRFVVLEYSGTREWLPP